MQIGLASRHHRSDRDKADQVRTQTTTSAVFYPHAPGAPILPLPSMCFFDPRSKPYASERSAQRNAPTGVLLMPEGRFGQECLFDRHLAGRQGLRALSTLGVQVDMEPIRQAPIILATNPITLWDASYDLCWGVWQLHCDSESISFLAKRLDARRWSRKIWAGERTMFCIKPRWG